MKSYEIIKCNSATFCSHNLLCGKNPSVDEDMLGFIEYNVGRINSGWKPEITESGEVYFLYVNIDNVYSDTLNITRIKNDIYAEIPNLYGIGFTLDSKTGVFKLLGRNSVELSVQKFPLETILKNIEYDTNLGTVTFKFNNADDIVLNLKEIISLSDYYTKEEINEMFKVKTNVIDDSEVEFTVLDNSDTSFTNLSKAEFIIPSDIVHGYAAAMSLRITAEEPEITFTYNGSYNKKFIMNGAFVVNVPFSNQYQYELLLLCDGVDLKIYVQELEI